MESGGEERAGDGAVTKQGQQILKEVLGDRYEVVAKLGSGAFGDVFRARDNVLEREVAIKRIRLDAFADPDQLEEVKKRFLREAQVAARLRHPNIVTTYDVVSTSAGSFIVMELVEGRTLQSILKTESQLSLDKTIDVLSQVASALEHAHQNQVIHRDVKPGNIMIEPSGQAKVMDFGIAKLESGKNLTATGGILGTPNYMSPEQARGSKIDGRSDVFALGCILYECLSGQKAFKGDSITAILLSILSDDPAPFDFEAKGLPPALSGVLRKATAKEPGERYAAATELMEGLRAVKEGHTAGVEVGQSVSPVVPRAPSPEAESSTERSKKPVFVIGGLVALIVAFGLLLGTGILSDDSGSAPPPSAGAEEEGGLVVEEELGFFGKVLGKEPRLFITVPADTELVFELEEALSSETASVGDTFTAAVAGAISIEGIEAVPVGSQLRGHVSHAAPAGKVSGRGELTLELDRLVLADGSQIDIRANPLSFKARGTKKKDAGIVGGLAGIGAAVGGIIGGKKGAVIGGAAGGSAGAGVVLSTKGQEVVLGENQSLAIQLLEPISVTSKKTLE